MANFGKKAARISLGFPLMDERCTFNSVGQCMYHEVASLKYLFYVQLADATPPLFDPGIKITCYVFIKTSHICLEMGFNLK